MTPCRECSHPISESAFSCPQCGAPYPARPAWNGYGFEYKSKWAIGHLPLVHISFKYRQNRTPVVAHGVVAIGQFAYGIICISQFGIGLFSLSQFTIAGFAIAQFGIAYRLLGQIGIFVDQGRGQLMFDLTKLLQLH